jgi:hypothetical protein
MALSLTANPFAGRRTMPDDAPSLDAIADWIRSGQDRHRTHGVDDQRDGRPRRGWKNLFRDWVRGYSDKDLESARSKLEDNKRGVELLSGREMRACLDYFRRRGR